MNISHLCSSLMPKGNLRHSVRIRSRSDGQSLQVVVSKLERYTNLVAWLTTPFSIVQNLLLEKSLGRMLWGCDK